MAETEPCSECVYIEYIGSSEDEFFEAEQKPSHMDSMHAEAPTAYYSEDPDWVTEPDFHDLKLSCGDDFESSDSDGDIDYNEYQELVGNVARPFLSSMKAPVLKRIGSSGAMPTGTSCKCTS